MKAKVTNRKSVSSQRTLFGIVAIAFCVVCAVVLISVLGVSYAGAFNFGESEQKIEDKPASDQVEFVETKTTETDTLQTSSKRDVSALYQNIKDEEDEKARIEAEKKRAHDEECIAKGVTNKAAAGNPNDGVDFTVGRDAFVKEWGARLDAYLSGSTLAGYGEKFADAAFENGIDPRVSAAISNTESTKGANCFRSHNAWGWMGDTVWDSWETAIYAHAKGFADGYGYTVTLAGAQKYCPPTYQDWYSKTTAQIALI